MEFEFDNSFLRDEKKAPKQILIQLYDLLQVIESVKQVSHIPQIKKLKGHKQAYRIKLSGYRIGAYMENGKLILSRLLPRKDVYKKFP